MIAAVFDTETTGLIDNRARALSRQPEIIEFACAAIDWDSYEVIWEYETLVRPVHPLPDKTIETTRLTDADLAASPSFKDVADAIEKSLAADLVVAHNLSFDMEMVDIEFERLKRRVAWPAIKICTVEQSIHVTGNRIPLGALYQMITGEEHGDAHRAMADVRANIVCLRGMRERGWL